HECQRELQTLAAGYVFEYRWRHFRIAESGRVTHAFVKEIHRHIEDARHFVKAASTNAVDAFLVFLHLLKCKAEQIAQLFLTHSNQHAPDANAIADLHVDGIGLLLWHGAHFSGRAELARSIAQRKHLNCEVASDSAARQPKAEDDRVNDKE